MRIAFFTKGDRTVASSRTRVYQVQDKIAKHGIDSKVKHVPGIPWWEISYRRWENFKKIFQLFWGFNSDDVLYFHRTTSQWDFILLVLFFRIFFLQKYVFDFDDAIFIRYPLKTWLLTKFASKVVVGSHFLKEYAENLNKKTEIIPTSVDIEIYTPATDPKNQKEEFIIGWVGGGTHRENLSFLQEVFRESHIKNKIRFVLLGPDNDPANYCELFRGIDNLNFSYIDQINWKKTRKEIVPLIQRFDLGVMPLKDTPWNRGKCAFKAIEYMACGVPALASDIGENRHLIEHQKNGFIVNNDISKWSKRLTSIVEKKNQLEEVGKGARERVEKNYSYSANIPALIDFIINKS